MGYSIVGTNQVASMSEAARYGDAPRCAALLNECMRFFPFHLSDACILRTAGDLLETRCFDTALAFAQIVVKKGHSPEGLWIAAEAASRTDNFELSLQYATELLDDPRFDKRAASLAGLSNLVLGKARGDLATRATRIRDLNSRAMPSRSEGFREKLARNRDYEVLYNGACLEALLGNKDAAIERFEQACHAVMQHDHDDRAQFLTWIKSDTSDQCGDLWSVRDRVLLEVAKVETSLAINDSGPRFELHGQCDVKASEVRTVQGGLGRDGLA